jgi:hypothetical protein
MSDFARSGSFAAQSLQALRQLFRDLSDPYRPELHYMRGPGPKWREKHGSQLARTLAPEGGDLQAITLPWRSRLYARPSVLGRPEPAGFAAPKARVP